MRFQVDEAKAEVQLRKIALHLAVSGLRVVEEYRRLFGEDNDRVMIILAVTASTLERTLRTDESGEFSDIRRVMPDEQIAPCNVASIAAATGLPRETARRKVKTLVDEGILRRDRRGAISFAVGVGQSPVVSKMLRKQAGEIARLATAFSEAGVIAPIAPALAVVEGDRRAA